VQGGQAFDCVGPGLWPGQADRRAAGWSLKALRYSAAAHGMTGYLRLPPSTSLGTSAKAGQDPIPSNTDQTITAKNARKSLLAWLKRAEPRPMEIRVWGDCAKLLRQGF